MISSLLAGRRDGSRFACMYLCVCVCVLHEGCVMFFDNHVRVVGVLLDRRSIAELSSKSSGNGGRNRSTA